MQLLSNALIKRRFGTKRDTHSHHHHHHHPCSWGFWHQSSSELGGLPHDFRASLKPLIDIPHDITPERFLVFSNAKIPVAPSTDLWHPPGVRTSPGETEARKPGSWTHQRLTRYCSQWNVCWFITTINTIDVYVSVTQLLGLHTNLAIFS